MGRAVALLQGTAVVCCTSSGHISLRVAHERPESLILSLTPMLSTARRLALVWGVHSVCIADMTDANQMTQLASETLRRDDLAAAGQFIDAIWGTLFRTPRTTRTTSLTQIARV